eukprot:1068204-Rhodomonas_salina.1
MLLLVFDFGLYAGGGAAAPARRALPWSLTLDDVSASPNTLPRGPPPIPASVELSGVSGSARGKR